MLVSVSFHDKTQQSNITQLTTLPSLTSSFQIKSYLSFWKPQKTVLRILSSSSTFLILLMYDAWLWTDSTIFYFLLHFLITRNICPWRRSYAKINTSQRLQTEVTHKLWPFVLVILVRKTCTETCTVHTVRKWDDPALRIT